MGTPSRRKRMRLSNSILPLMWKAAAPGRPARSLRMASAFTPCADQHLRAADLVPQGKQLFQHFFAGQAVGCSAAGQHRVDAQGGGVPVGLQRVAADVDGAVQGQAGTFRCPPQPAGGVHIQAAAGSQRPDDKTVRTGAVQGP